MFCSTIHTLNPYRPTHTKIQSGILSSFCCFLDHAECLVLPISCEIGLGGLEVLFGFELAR
jgi:hypothetical protein